MPPFTPAAASNGPSSARQIEQSGLSAQQFADILADEDLSFQDIFGANVLLKVEFDVAGLGEHSHFVFIPEPGEAPEVITSFPQGKRLRVSAPQPWASSPHSPSRNPKRRQRIAKMAENFTREAWQDMARLAQDIDQASLNYHFIFQNSNSVAATLADHVGLKFKDLKGGGFNLGSKNLLYDELAGGAQPRAFLVRGGTSYASGFEAKVLPRNSNLESDA